jgi:hypothetical protein
MKKLLQKMDLFLKMVLLFFGIWVAIIILIIVMIATLQTL